MDNGRTQEDVVVPAQREVEVFENTSGGVTFRHPPTGDPYDTEQMVVVPIPYIPALISRLKTILREASEATEAE